MVERRGEIREVDGGVKESLTLRWVGWELEASTV